MTKSGAVVRTADPVAIFGGPYSNLEATQAFFNEAAPASGIWASTDTLPGLERGEGGVPLKQSQVFFRRRSPGHDALRHAWPAVAQATSPAVARGG